MTAREDSVGLDRTTERLPDAEDSVRQTIRTGSLAQLWAALLKKERVEGKGQLHCLLIAPMSTSMPRLATADGWPALGFPVTGSMSFLTQPNAPCILPNLVIGSINS